jgi:hypothetical protein
MALMEIIGRTADKLRVAYLAARGFMSGQAIKESADRFRLRETEGRAGMLLYLGDLDPSGALMSEDVQRRLSLYGSNAEVKRIALNVEQSSTVRFAGKSGQKKRYTQRGVY